MYVCMHDIESARIVEFHYFQILLFLKFVNQKLKFLKNWNSVISKNLEFLEIGTLLILESKNSLTSWFYCFSKELYYCNGIHFSHHANGIPVW